MESFYEWIGEKSVLKGNPPFPQPVKGIQLTNRLQAYVERKLFTLNTGHVMTAYLGYLQGCEYIAESIDLVAQVVHQAMQESGADRGGGNG